MDFGLKCGVQSTAGQGEARMRIEPEIAGVSLVMLGHFNPLIFSHSWFGWHGLLPEEIVNNARVQIAHPDITKFNADWLNLQVDRERFIINTVQAPYVRLQDLAVRIFRDQLPHTPLKVLGINREIHFSVKKFEERDRLGRALAPVEPWGEWGKKLEPDGKHGGMTTLNMRQLNPEGRTAGGQINVTVEPSNKVGDGLLGVYVRVNDHYVIKNTESQTATSEIVKLLEDNFAGSLQRANKIIDHLMSLTEK